MDVVNGFLLNNCMKTLREYINIIESLEQGVEEGLMSSLAARAIKGAANQQTPQEIANMHVRALNQRAPGTKMHNHPDFSDFKREVHSYVSAAKTGEEAFRRTMDDHVKSLAKKYFGGQGVSKDLDENQEDPIQKIDRLFRDK